MKLRTKRPDSHGVRWLQVILFKPWENKPRNSHYEAFNIGYHGGMENQRYADARICAILFDNAQTDEEREAIKKCWEAITKQTIRKPL